MTPATFRQTLPEFASTTDYPDATVQFFLNVAAITLNVERWADLLDLGTAYFVAHHLVIGRRDELAAQGGGIPGQVTGPQTSKSVDKVSVSYDTGSVVALGGEAWNMTTYGIRFVKYLKMVGAGGIQL